MNRAERLLAFAIAASTAALLVLAAASVPADAACPPTFVGNANTTYALGATSPSVFQTSQLTTSWAAVAIRPATGEDWDLTLYQSFLPDPTCLNTALAGSNAGSSVVDFVLGDYTYDPTGTYYTGCSRYSGAGGPSVRWENARQSLTVNGIWTSRSWNSLELISIWDVSLVSGVNYSFEFVGVSGSFDVKMMLFRNPAASTYWVGRSSALLTSSATASFTAPATGHYAVVVVNDNGGTGTFNLRVGACTTPIALTSTATQTTTDVYSYWSFNQANAYWTAVAVRSAVNDYDIGVYGNTAGSGWPNCFGDPKASSTGVGQVDLVVGDFNLAPTGSFYVYTNTFGPPTGAEVQWDSGPNQLYADGAPISGHSGPGKIVECWDVNLTRFQQYNFSFQQSGSNLHLLLFRNWAGGAYWTGRAGAEFDVTTCHAFSAAYGGYYALVIVNDTGESSDYTLGITTYPCQCPFVASDGPPSSTYPDGDWAFAPTHANWSVVGTKGYSTADDWDLTVSDQQSGSGPPLCLGNTLINSAYGATTADIGVIDFNRTPGGTYYFHAHHYSGPSYLGVVQWDGSHGVLDPNGPYLSVPMSAGDVAHSWDAYMQAGVTYTIEFQPGAVSQRLLVFENSGVGSYFANRGNAVLTTTATTTYTPTVTGYHGLIVVNDDFLPGFYTIRFGTCGAPQPLANGAAQFPSSGVNTYSFAQPASLWGAVGVRSGSTDWDLYVSASLSGVYPTCIGPSLGSSTSSTLNKVDFVVGDFFHNAPGTYYAQVSQYTNGALVPAPVEWSSEAEILVNDNNATTHVSDATNLIQCYSVSMTASRTYRFAFSHAGGANVHLLVFRNSGGGTYWVSRGLEEFDLAGSASADYVAPGSGEYGVVVVNDDGVADSWSLTVKTCSAPVAMTSNVVYTETPSQRVSQLHAGVPLLACHRRTEHVGLGHRGRFESERRSAGHLLRRHSGRLRRSRDRGLRGGGLQYRRQSARHLLRAALSLLGQRQRRPGVGRHPESSDR